MYHKTVPKSKSKETTQTEMNERTDKNIIFLKLIRVYNTNLKQILYIKGT